MQGLILSLKRKHRHFRGLPDIRGVLRRFGSSIFFSVTLAGGLLCGSLVSGSIGSSTLEKLDLLFTANLPDRIKSGALGAFCAGFASDFLFLAAAFLLGLSLWGVVGLPLLAFFKGFGIGVSAGYLISVYGTKGILFYLVVVLPGVCVFCTALVCELRAAFDIYRRLVSTLLLRSKTGFRGALLYFLKKSLSCLAVALAAAVIDALLWFTFSGVFISAA